MSVIGVHQILKGEEGFVDLSKPAQPEPVRVPVKPSSPQEDRISLDGIAVTVEGLLRELKRGKATPERIAEIDASLKAKICGLLGEVVSVRRVKTGVSRQASDTFETVRAARRLYLSVGPSNHDELLVLATEALELFKTECQSETVKV